MNKLLCSSLLMLLIAGCGHTPVRTVYPAAMPPKMAENKVTAQRAEEFRQAIAPAKTRGVVIFPNAFFGRVDNEKVLDSVVKLGFNRIYCHLTSEQELDEAMTAFLTAAAQRSIPVEAVFSQQDFYRQYRSNRLIRNLLVQFPDLCRAAEKLLEYNSELPENIRFAALTIHLTPHRFDISNVERMRGKLYAWDAKRYGIGGDNDMLVRESYALAEKISRLPGMLPLTVAVPDFIHEKAAAGELSVGKVTDFAKFGKVIIISSANLPSRIPVAVKDELEALKDGKIIAAVPLAGHTSVTAGQLRRRNWRDFQRSINNLVRKSSGYSSFDGVIVSPLAVIEFLRMEE